MSYSYKSLAKFLVSGLLNQILQEVKSSNEDLKKKVSDLESKVCELQQEQDTPAPRKAKRPSRQVRVSVAKDLIKVFVVFWFTEMSTLLVALSPLVYTHMQDTVRKVYRSLSETDENFGWDLE